MATIKLILRKERINKAGEAPLYLRIIKDRKPLYTSMNIKLAPKFWNDDKQEVKSSYKGSGRLNAFLKDRLSKAHNKYMDMATSSNTVRTKDIKEEIIGKSSPLFLDYAFNYIKGYKTKDNSRTFKRFRTALNKLKAYLNGRHFTLEDMTILFLREYEQHLRDKYGNGVNTINTDLKSFRRILNQAVDEELFPYEKNPFLRYKLPWKQTKKVFLTEDEIKLFEDYEIQSGYKRELHRDIFIFACYVGGLRISDICVLKWVNFDGTHITCSTIKTGSVVSIKVPTKGLEIINKYKAEGLGAEDYLFPVLDRDADYPNGNLLKMAINSKNVYANKDLKFIAKKIGLTKNISFHTSRHTWATRALRKGMRIEYVSRLMGHASIRTTQIYAKIVNEDLDRAMGVFD